MVAEPLKMLRNYGNYEIIMTKSVDKEIIISNSTNNFYVESKLISYELKWRKPIDRGL